MNKLAVCVYVVAGILSVSANGCGGWGAYGDADLHSGSGHDITQHAVVVQSSHNGGGCGCGGGNDAHGWSGDGGAGHGHGWAGGAGAGSSSGCGCEQPSIVRHLKPIVVHGKKAKIIEHHSRPIYIRPTVTRFVVPAAPVVIKPMLIHKPSTVSIRPKLLTSSAPSQSMSPILLRVIKNIEQPATQRTVILEKTAPSSSCNIEASQGYATSMGAGCGCGGGH